MARSVRVNARITPEIKSALEKATKRTKWSESLIVSQAIEAWLQDNQEYDGPAGNLSDIIGGIEPQMTPFLESLGKPKAR
jgi:predicted DNA-binding protein